MSEKTPAFANWVFENLLPILFGSLITSLYYNMPESAQVILNSSTKSTSTVIVALFIILVILIVGIFVYDNIKTLFDD